jgi:protein-S-isoprenylcysteine O-methyltransferase Ste14
MRFEDKKLHTQRRKASWLTGLVCGPVFALIFCLAFFLPPLLTQDNFSLGLWIPLIGSVLAAAALADRFGKKYKITAEQFAGPVALCYKLFGGASVFGIMFILTCVQY